MKQHFQKVPLTVSAIVALTLVAMPAMAFVSGSTGVDGAFNPTVTTELQLPNDGIFNYTTVNIPSGVTVTFRRNTTNTPVVILASGNVTVAGTISVNGSVATNVGAAGDGNLGDDGVPGIGGPGGFDGGRGGTVGRGAGGSGLGPGGGGPAQFGTNSCFGANQPSGGGGGGFGGNGQHGNRGFAGNSNLGGTAYGTSQLLPLIGGSGGAGGSGADGFGGSGGGGGGGAILIASSGTLSITGAIVANGGRSGVSGGVSSGGSGGGGSGGAIRLMATTITGNGTVNALGAAANGSSVHSCFNGGNGGNGRVRLEAESITRTAATTPAHPAVSAPTTVFVAGLPSLRIASVAGVSAPPVPTGSADIVLPSTTANPVAVTFTTTGVPVGNTVRLRVVPAAGSVVSAISNALSGTTASATASVNVNLPSGPSTLEATTTFTIVASLGQEFGNQFAQGERVERVTLSAALNGPSMMTLTTVSGKEVTIPAQMAAGIL